MVRDDKVGKKVGWRGRNSEKDRANGPELVSGPEESVVVKEGRLGKSVGVGERQSYGKACVDSLDSFCLPKVGTNGSRWESVGA